jgi:RTA1 like protein
MIISDLAILLRAAYRVVELAQGWNGYLISTEPFFYGFDTAPMIVCMAVWVIGHPGYALGRELSGMGLRSKYVVESDRASGGDITPPTGVPSQEKIEV